MIEKMSNFIRRIPCYIFGAHEWDYNLFGDKYCNICFKPGDVDKINGTEWPMDRSCDD